MRDWRSINEEVNFSRRQSRFARIVPRHRVAVATSRGGRRISTISALDMRFLGDSGCD